jgi:IS30 family transposase
MYYTHLTEEERYQIYDLKREGFNQAQIAVSVGRSASTISRELGRNAGERGRKPRQAGLKAMERLCSRGSNNARKINHASWLYAEKKLVEEQWSPEQIAGRFALEGLEPISHETLYQCLLRDKKSGGYLYTHLRSRKKRKKRYGSPRSARGCIPNRVDIDKRPAIVED